jgi:hypothetical protein
VTTQPLSETVVLTLTRNQKQVLKQMAFARGATMRGYLRWLIRNAVDEHTTQQSVPKASEQEHADQG